MSAHGARRAPKILVFLQGTAFIAAAMHPLSRAQRVEFSRRQDPEVLDAEPVAAEGAVEKIWAWASAGAEIVYLSAWRDAARVKEDERALPRLGFPDGSVRWRRDGETYGAVAERELPDVIVEDDCESIGAAEITFNQLPTAARTTIRSVIVPEFGGLTHLPNDPDQLGRW